MASKTYSKRSARGIWMAITQPTSATNFGEHSKTFPSHDLLMTRRARRKSTKATTTSKKLMRTGASEDRWMVSPSCDE
jgi:hypothetical protein